MRARNFEFLDLDAEAALRSHAYAARHPQPRALAPRDDSRNGDGFRGRAEERHGDAAVVEEIADETQTAAAAYVIRDQARGGGGFLHVVAASEQAAGIEVLAGVAQVGVDVGVLDHAENRSRVFARRRHGPDGEFPVAHVERDADGRPELVAVAVEHALVQDLEARRLADDAIDLHGLGHDAAEVRPHGARDALALRLGFFRKCDRQIGHRAFVPSVQRRDQRPRLGGHGDAHVERCQAHQRDDEADEGVFETVAQIEEHVHGL